MNSKSTLLLLLLALLAGGGFFLARKHVPATEEAAEKGRRVFDFKSGEVTSLSIKGVDRDWAFEKQDGKWWMKKPLSVRASNSELDVILSTLEYLEQRRRLTPRDIREAHLTPADYGLEKPRLVALFKAKGREFTLNIGNESRLGEMLYVQPAGDPNVYLVDKYVAQRLGKKQEEYRERSLFDFPAAQAQRLEIKAGSKLIEFARTNSLWHIVQPLTARADTAKVDDFVRQVAGLRAEDFLSEEPAASKEHGLEEPAAEITLRLEKQESVHTLLIGQKLKGDDRKIAAKLKGQNSIVSLSTNFSAEVSRPLNDFRDRSLGRFNIADVSEIEIKNRNVGVLLQKEADGWKIVQPEKLPADPLLADQLLSRLSALQVREFTTDVLTDVEKYGLKSPASQIALRSKSGPLLTLAVGREDPSKKIAYVKLGDESSVYGVDAQEVASLPAGVDALRSRMLWSIKKDQLRACLQKKGKSQAGLKWSADQKKWILDEQSQGVLDETAWLKFLNMMERPSVEKILGTPTNAMRRQYGLDSPAALLTVSAEVDGKPLVQELEIGRPVAAKDSAVKKHYLVWKSRLLLCEISSEMHQVLASDWIRAAPAVSPAAPK